MRKHAPARVSYRNDFLISYRVYMMTRSCHYMKVHFMLIKYTSQLIQNRNYYAVPVYRQTDFKPKRVAVRVYIMPLRDFVPE